MTVLDQHGSGPSFKGRVVSAIKWQAAAQGIGQVITWLSTLVVIRLLSSDDYGLVAMSGVLTAFFFLLADMGIGAASIQAATVSRDDLRQLGGLTVLTNVAGFLLALPTAPLLARYFREPRIVEFVLAQSVTFLLIALYALPQSQLVRAMEFKSKARIDSAAMLASASVAISMALLGGGAWSLVGANLTLHAARAVGYRLVVRDTPAPSFALTGAQRFITFGALLTLDRLLFFAFSQADVVIGGRLLGSDRLGVYTVALSIAVIPMDKVLPIINQVAFSAYSRIQGEMARVQRSVTLVVRLVSFGAFPTFFGLSAVASTFVPVVLGEKWIAIVQPLQLVSLILPLKAIAAVLPPALYGTGQPRVSVVNLSWSLALLVVALLIGVPFGVLGLCLAWVTAYPVIFVLTVWRTAKALDIAPSRFLAELTFPLLAAALMGAVVVGLGHVLPEAWPAALTLVLQILAGAVAYGTLVLTLKRPLLVEAVSLLRR